MKTIKLKEEKKGGGGRERKHTQKVKASKDGWKLRSQKKGGGGGGTYTQGKNIQGLMKNQEVKRENEGKES